MMCVGGEDERVIRVMCVGVHSQLYSKYFEVDIDYQPTHWQEPKADVSYWRERGGSPQCMIQAGEDNKTDQSTLA